MSDPADLEQELAMWGKRLGYDPSFVDPHEPLMNKIDYSRQLKGEKQIDPPRLEDNTIFNEVCDKCCQYILIINVNRNKKGFKPEKPIEKIDKKTGIITIIQPKWVSTSGDLSVELWTNNQGKPGYFVETLSTGKTIELGGAPSPTEGSMKMFPAGDHELWSHFTAKGKTVGYSTETSMAVKSKFRKPYPALGIRGFKMGSRAGILFHSGQDYTWLEGCIILAPHLEKHAERPFFSPYPGTHEKVVELIEIVDKFLKTYTYSDKGVGKSAKLLPCIIVRVENNYD